MSLKEAIKNLRKEIQQMYIDLESSDKCDLGKYKSLPAIYKKKKELKKLLKEAK